MAFGSTSAAGKPTDNAYIETFNGPLRDECLNLHWFASISEARWLIETWRVDYNVNHPHMALGNLAPAEYLAGPETWPAPIGAGQAGN
ncbi:MAG: transposase [Sphingopyxis sp.]|nr:transposase [Sphingopyxis sp.]